MYCKKCGSYLPDDSVFCSSCGTSTSDGVTSQTQNNKTDVFCSLGFLFSFLLYGFVGLILSVIGVRRTTKNGTRGKGLGIAGIIIGAIKILICSMILITGISRYLDAAKARANTTSSNTNNIDVFETESTAYTPDFSSALAAIESESNNIITISYITGDTYHNELIGFDCTLLDGWTYYTDEQLAEKNNISFEEVTHKGNNLPKESGEVFWDMEAKNETGLSDISIGYENLKLTSNITISESEYIDIFREKMIAEYESRGYTSIQTNDSMISIANTKYPSILFELEKDDITLYQRIVFATYNDYMCIISITCANEDNTEEILASFR